MSKGSKIKASAFTSMAALVREILVLLGDGYKLEIIITPEQKERLDNELDGVKGRGRVRVSMDEFDPR
jgi:hypothetical protein